MSFIRNNTVAAMLALAGIACVGCGQDVDQDDLTAQRENVNEEERETQQAQNEMENEINEEQTDVENERNAARPDYDDIRDEQKDVDEARREGREAVNEEERETNEARRELNETEAKLEAQKNRDAFLAGSVTLLNTADTRIEELKQLADTQEGATQEATETQIDELQNAHDNLEEAVDDVKSAEPLKWESKKAAVDSARIALQQELDEAK